MAGRPENLVERMEPFFGALLGRDPTGGSWLPELLAATPRGRASLGDLVDTPGWLQTLLAARTVSGRMAAFEYVVAPSRRLLAWYIDHPDALNRPVLDDGSPLTDCLHRALLDDDPPGSRRRAQDRAHEQLRRSSPLAEAWWRFEDATRVDCVLMTDRLVVTIEGRCADEPPSATAWYPQRSRLVGVIEAARRLSEGKAWGSLLISDEPLDAGRDEQVARAIDAGAPHLDADERPELRDAYLGNLTWEAAAAAVGSSAGGD